MTLLAENAAAGLISGIGKYDRGLTNSSHSQRFALAGCTTIECDRSPLSPEASANVPR